jgi:hypothetical protein
VVIILIKSFKCKITHQQRKLVVERISELEREMGKEMEKRDATKYGLAAALNS